MRRSPEALAFSQTSPSTAAARNELAIKMREAPARLSEPHRQVIQLRRLEEAPVSAIAELMDRSENAIRILYCRAIQSLRQEMGG